VNNGTDRSTRRDGMMPTGEDLCLYIAEICDELRSLARSPRFRMINYLLDMARLEAERSANEFRSDGHQRSSDER